MDLNKDSVPVIIPTFNQPTLLRMTIDQLSNLEIEGPVVIYDNNSSYPEMIDLLEELSEDHCVIRVPSNLGPRVFTEDIAIMNLLPDYYIVTDPDLIYNISLPTNFMAEMRSSLKSLDLAKIGFALEIYDEEEMAKFLDVSSVHEWEESYWKDQMGKTKSGSPIYRAWIDTTFSLNSRNSCIYYRKFDQPTFRYPSARIAGDYTARHVGWWKKELQPQSKAESEFYLRNQKWSHTENYYYKGKS